MKKTVLYSEPFCFRIIKLNLNFKFLLFNLCKNFPCLSLIYTHKEVTGKHFITQIEELGKTVRHLIFKNLNSV